MSCCCCSGILLALAALTAYFYYRLTARKEVSVHGKKFTIFSSGETNSQKKKRTRRKYRNSEKSALKLAEPRRNEIAEWNFKTVQAKLQSGEVTCLEVLQTYQWKAIQAHKKTNCATIFVKEAEQWARNWDEKAKDTEFKKPVFFGTPISLKECKSLKGYDQTRGYAQHLFEPSENDAVLVQQIKDFGMIPFVMTNVPQSLLAYNSCNPIYGETNHPLTKDRTSGGSSGGESAIIAADGSLIGIGGDAGGSLRMPCHFTGITGIKPSHLRFSHRGVCGSVPGRPLINSNDGPMAKDVDSVVAFLRESWNNNYIRENDPYVPPVNWNQQLYTEERKLRIGYYVDDGWFTPIPAVQRAVLEAKAHLEAAGHTLVPFKPPTPYKMINMFIRAVCVDGGQFLLNKLRNDIVHPTLRVQVFLYSVPIWLNRILSYPVSLFFPRLAHVMNAMARTTSELRCTYADIESYRYDFTQLLLDDKIDALLCPPQVLTAPTHDIPCKLFPAVCYSAIFNLLDYGAGSVNVTFVNKEDDRKLKTEYPQTDPWYKLARKTCEDCIGYPVGVQVAAPPYREEIVMRIMKEIETAVENKSH